MTVMPENYLLIIDTHAPAACVMLADAEGNILHEVTWLADKTLGVKLLLAIGEMLAKTGTQWGDVKRVAVHEGPGHYSALRTGVVTASFLASEKTLELVAISGEQKEDWLRQAKNATPVSVVKPNY